MPKAEGFSHIHLLVSDFDRSIAFYQALGFEERFRLREEMVFLSTSDQSAWLTLHLSESEMVGTSGGISHFGLALAEGEDLDAALEEVEQTGGMVVERGEHQPGLPFAMVKDPDGYNIEL